MSLAIDSTHRLDPAAVKAAGASAVIRYLQTGSRPSWKSATKDEMDAYRAAGLGVGGVWEVTATRALQGYAAGHADAVAANAAADALGLSDSLTLAWTVDTDVSGYGQVAEYDRGWCEGSKRPVNGNGAPYGEKSVIDGSVAAGRSRSGWQTNARGWSGRKVSVHASLLQGLPSTSPIPNTDPNVIVDMNTPFIQWPQSPTDPTPSKPAFSPPTYPGHVLKVGDRGHDVEVAKLLMVAAGYHGFAMRNGGSRVYTPGFKWAVARFQRRHHLAPVTGQIGPATWGKLRQVVIDKHNAKK